MSAMRAQLFINKDSILGPNLQLDWIEGDTQPWHAVLAPAILALTLSPTNLLTIADTIEAKRAELQALIPALIPQEPEEPL